jgi:hypothetical protein
MATDIFERYINTMEIKPQWDWQQQAGNGPYDSIWIARSADNEGKAGMVCPTEKGYRASLCLECPYIDDSSAGNVFTIETAIAHESDEFLTATEAMIWVERQAWCIMARIFAVQSQLSIPPRLLVRNGDSSHEFAWSGTQMNIGRAASSDIVIAHPLASRQHARIEQHSYGFLLSDLESTNGTYVNGIRIKEGQMLNHQDRIVIADTVITFHHPAAAP